MGKRLLRYNEEDSFVYLMIEIVENNQTLPPRYKRGEG